MSISPGIITRFQIKMLDLDKHTCMSAMRNFNLGLFVWPCHRICADYIHGDGGLKKKRRCSPPSANLPPAWPRLMTRNNSLANISQNFHNYNALLVCWLSLYVFTRTRIMKFGSFPLQDCMTFEIHPSHVMSLVCQFLQPTKPCVSSTPYIQASALSHLHRLRNRAQNLKQSRMKKKEAMHMFPKKPHCNKDRCAEKRSSQNYPSTTSIIYYLPLASMCLGFNTIHFHYCLVKSESQHNKVQGVKIWKPWGGDKTGLKRKNVCIAPQICCQTI